MELSATAKCCGEIKKVAQWATIAHLEASIMFGKIIIYDAQWQVTLNLNQSSGINSNTQRYYYSPGYLQVLKRSELKLRRKLGETIFFRCSTALNSVASDVI